jgi:hypothetical protein
VIHGPFDRHSPNYPCHLRSSELAFAAANALQAGVQTKSGPGLFIPEPLRKLTRVITALAVECPLLFSFRAPASSAPVLAQQQLALRPLAAPQVDHRHLARALFHLALRPDQHRQAAWLEVY